MSEAREIIILGSTKTGDNSLVIHTLSEEYGRRGFIVTVGRHTSTAAFLPLSIVEARITENPKSSLWRAGSCRAVFPLMGIRNNVYKNAICLFISEVLFRIIRDGAREEGLYQWCRKSILTLDALPGDFSNFHVYFLLELASALGFRPEFSSLLPFCDGSDSRENCAAPIRQMLQCDFGGAMLMPLSGSMRRSMCESILAYISHHAECSLRIKSLDILGELFR